MLRISIALYILHIIHAYSIGDVDPRALQGVWRLTSLDQDGLPFERTASSRPAFFPPQSSTASSDPKTIWKLRGFLPMKEFTTYPKKKKSEVVDIGMMDGSDEVQPKKQTEIFIKLKDDHTFEQCTALQFSDGEDETQSLEEKLELELSKREKESFLWTGTWDFVDMKLILAADRPEKKPFSVYDEDENDSVGVGVDTDTILIGRVAVQQEDSLTDNPALQDSDTSALQPKTIDVHLSVPKGKIKTGKFMYPKDHPRFFEQPIYSPESTGRFELRQILGEYNAKLDDDEGELVELFRKNDLVGKRFYLSTFPIPKRRKKFEYWDNVAQTYKTGYHEPTDAEKKEDELTPGNNMQVMSVELFANNTFSTISGLGSSTILRGKWSIIGEKRDQLWMQVYRFGWGRSVSGSTFSEGMSLTQDDDKAYWGLITQEADGGNDSIETDPSEWGDGKIEITEGAVMLGWGLEPTTVGRFKMIEIDDDDLEEEDDEEEEEDDEEEYVEMSADDVMENANSLDSIMGSDGSDLEGTAEMNFDQPGAFE